jgi:KaiC/GvpD/RAD55 family RecA-like ATPase
VKREERAGLQSLPSGVPGLDAVLGGGLPEYSFNLVVGGPGAGKTTLAHQIMFANATAERPALYFTVLGEPTLKMLRYQRQFSFFDPDLAGSAIQFINLSAEVTERDLDEVLQPRLSVPNRELLWSIHSARSEASMAAPSRGRHRASTNSFSASPFTSRAGR